MRKAAVKAHRKAIYKALQDLKKPLKPSGAKGTNKDYKKPKEPLVCFNPGDIVRTTEGSVGEVTAVIGAAGNEIVKLSVAGKPRSFKLNVLKEQAAGKIGNAGWGWPDQHVTAGGEYVLFGQVPKSCWGFGHPYCIDPMVLAEDVDFDSKKVSFRFLTHIAPFSYEETGPGWEYQPILPTRTLCIPIADFLEGTKNKGQCQSHFVFNWAIPLKDSGFCSVEPWYRIAKKGTNYE